MKASIVVKAIIVLLVILSIISWGIALNRFFVLFSLKAKDKRFYKKFYSNTKFSELNAQVNKLKHPVGIASIFKQGLAAYQQSKVFHNQTPEAVIDLINKKINTTVVNELEEQDVGLNLLSIITGISPYIGLFGTVWGIIEVFVNLGAASQVNIQTVAPGISEALIATAMGLFVAIPALFWYNIFHRMVMFNENQYYNFQDQFTSIIQDDIYRRLGQVTHSPTIPRKENTANSGTNVAISSIPNQQ